MSTARHDAIRDLLFARGQSTVNELADLLNVSPVTVRRDLIDMEANGIVERSHGAARLAPARRGEAAFSVREQNNIAAKRAIASRAMDWVKADATIFLDAGTTVLQLARLIKTSGLSLTVVTNGLAVAEELAGSTGIDLTLIGGTPRPQNLSLVGPLAERGLEEHYFDHLFLGVSAIADKGWVSSFDAAEARLNQIMVRRAEQIVVLADASKFGLRANFGVLHLNRDQIVISDLPAYPLDIDEKNGKPHFICASNDHI